MTLSNSKYLKNLSSVMYFAGLFSMVFSGMQMQSYASSHLTFSLWNALINACIGILDILAGWLISEGKKSAVLVIIAAIAASLIFGSTVGRGLNVYMVLIGSVFLAWTIFLWRKGQLA